jgi:hypothetical protein
MRRCGKYFLSASLFMVLGCGGGNRHEGLALVTGQITFEGKPAPAGQITFYPVDGKRSSSSAIDSSGNYKLTCYDPGDGALIGRHKVVVDATEVPPPAPDFEAADGGAATPPYKPPRRILPPEYYSQATTPLEAEVEDEENVIDFNIPK